jgi:glucose-6-phosphate isomerase
MHSIRVAYQDTCLFEQHELEPLIDQLVPEIQCIMCSLEKKYKSPYAALYVPDDTALRVRVKAVARMLMQSQPTLILLVGIGGSSLGPQALFQALYGSYYNMLLRYTSGIEFYCVDTLDADLLVAYLKIAEQVLQEGKQILIIVITKSGTTTETIINGAFCIEMLKKYRPTSYRKYIVVLTDRVSPLYTLAREQDYICIEIPALVGGRYSLLSAVGLLPLALLGADIDSLHEGARVMRELCLDTRTPYTNTALMCAALLYKHYSQGRTIHDTFVFSPDFVGFANWYRQLVGESLAKQLRGITPTVSLGTTDLHSVIQLYLAGPHDKVTTFVYPEYNNNSPILKVPDTEIACLVPGLANKTVTTVTHALFRGVQAAYRQAQRPFITLEFDIKSSYVLGQYSMLKQCQVLYLGYLLGASVFDQPAVELYKHKTREILRMHK